MLNDLANEEGPAPEGTDPSNRNLELCDSRTAPRR